MKLTYKGLADKEAWGKAGIELPPYDPQKLAEDTRKEDRKSVV